MVISTIVVFIRTLTDIGLAWTSRPTIQMKPFYLILAVVFSLNYYSYAAPRVISVGLFVQSAFGADLIYNLFRSDLLSLRNIVVKNRVPYEQGIHVFAQPV